MMLSPYPLLSPSLKSYQNKYCKQRNKLFNHQLLYYSILNYTTKYLQFLV